MQFIRYDIGDSSATQDKDEVLFRYTTNMAQILFIWWLINDNFQDIRANLQVSLFVMLTSIFSIIYGGNLNLSMQLATIFFLFYKILIFISVASMLYKFVLRFYKPNELLKVIQTK